MSDAPSETSRWMIARSRTRRIRTCETCRCVSAYIHTQITTFLNADRDVDLSGAKTADAVPSRHRLLPFDNRGPSSPLSLSLSPSIFSSLFEFRVWRSTKMRRKRGRKHAEKKERRASKSARGNHFFEYIVARYMRCILSHAKCRNSRS